jgi:hypothetical protein
VAFSISGGMMGTNAENPGWELPVFSYEEALKLIKTGDYIAVRDTDSLLGKLISKITGRPYTHACVAKWVGKELFVASLNSGYNHLACASHLTDFDVFDPPVGIGRGSIDTAINNWLRKRIKYGYAAFIAIGIESITKFSRLFDNWRSIVVCSGGTVMIYEMAANLQYEQKKYAPKEWMRHSRQLSPGELAEELTFKIAVRGGEK